MRMAARQPAWALGFEDETWWSRLQSPALHAWAEAERPVRLVEQERPPDDRDPKALACYGLLLSSPADPAWDSERIWLRFVEGRPVSALTAQFLAWTCERLAAQGKRALLLVWDNAPWHVSRAVRSWIREHNRQVQRERCGVRVVSCYLPVKSPWLNPIEPHWVHGKRRVLEPDRLLSAHELEQRVCATFDCAQETHLVIPENVT